MNFRKIVDTSFNRSDTPQGLIGRGGGGVALSSTQSVLVLGL